MAPTVAARAPPTPTPDDKIDCHKHPPHCICQSRLDDRTALNPLSPDAGCCPSVGVNAAIGINLFKGDDEPPAAEYIAEGGMRVSTASRRHAKAGTPHGEAVVVNEPGNGAFVSPDVRIGGPLPAGQISGRERLITPWHRR